MIVFGFTGPVAQECADILVAHLESHGLKVEREELPPSRDDALWRAAHGFPNAVVLVDPDLLQVTNLGGRLMSLLPGDDLEEHVIDMFHRLETMPV